jgi:diadenosine tetraphosphatase ApaH/serine/threonine PP2A family protein phosphatase
MIKRFFRYYKPHRRLFIADLFCAFLLAICDLFYPMITRSMMNDFIPNKKIRTLVLCGILLLVIYLIKMGLKYFINVGSVGQPRDGDPRACYAIFDSDARTVTLRRVEYDVVGAQQAVLAVGLPAYLADRLGTGQ